MSPHLATAWASFLREFSLYEVLLPPVIANPASGTEAFGGRKLARQGVGES